MAVPITILALAFFLFAASYAAEVLRRWRYDRAIHRPDVNRFPIRVNRG